jgi:hypothetical protein
VMSLEDNIRALYQTCASVVRTNDGMTDEFTLSTGVRQGCVLSPILFNIYMDRITSEANQEGYSNSQLTPRN